MDADAADDRSSEDDLPAQMAGPSELYGLSDGTEYEGIQLATESATCFRGVGASAPAVVALLPAPSSTKLHDISSADAHASAETAVLGAAAACALPSFEEISQAFYVASSVGLLLAAVAFRFRDPTTTKTAKKGEIIPEPQHDHAVMYQTTLVPVRYTTIMLHFSGSPCDVAFGKCWDEAMLEKMDATEMEAIALAAREKCGAPRHGPMPTGLLGAYATKAQVSVLVVRRGAEGGAPLVWMQRASGAARMVVVEAIGPMHCERLWVAHGMDKGDVDGAVAALSWLEEEVGQAAPGWTMAGPQQIWRAGWVGMDLSDNSDLTIRPGEVRRVEAGASRVHAPLQVDNEEGYLHARTSCADSPADFWQPIAARELHWFHPEREVWLSKGADGWTGWSAADGSPCAPEARWWPWVAAMDASQAPIVRWFCGAQTNAAFNELDRHVLALHGAETAFIAEPEPGHGEASRISRRQLLLKSALAAHSLSKGLGVGSCQLVALHLPNGLHAVVWIEAAKRLGVPYCAIAGGTSSSSLAQRLEDTGAVAVVVSGGLLAAAQEAVSTLNSHPVLVLLDALEGQGDGCLNGAALLAAAQGQLARAAGVTEPEALSEVEMARSAWRLAAPRPVESSWPLFVLYTSGSTGKPKGIVHTHGGYQVGLVATTRLVFAVHPEKDVLCVVATPGWITGQSYMIAATLLCRVPSILLDGSPSSPPDRVAAVMARHGTTVLKAGSTFLRMLMASPRAAATLATHDLSQLRLGTFCAEPVNEAAHRFAAAHLSPNYINCYWATEHGGIVWGRCHSNADQPLRPDTRTWPLPWIDGEVMVESVEGGWRRAADGEQGEVVIRRQYPYMALTVWCSEGFGEDGWRGDARRWAKYFVDGAGYVQGDAAVRQADAFTFHGRSDEVINVGGNRIGTEEIESALLLDREAEGSPILNCAVVGMDDTMLGTVPCAFVVLHPDASLRQADERRLRALVQARHSSAAVPARFVAVEALPETHSGKYMRRLLRALLSGAPLGDLGALRNPECVAPLKEAVRRRGVGVPTAAPAAAPAAAAPPPPEAFPAVPSLEVLVADISALVNEHVGGSACGIVPPLRRADSHFLVPKGQPRQRPDVSAGGLACCTV